MENKTTMEKLKKGITFSQFLAVLTGIVIPLMIWGVSVETRLTEAFIRITQNEKNYSEMKSDIKQIKNMTTKILIKLEQKKDK